MSNIKPMFLSLDIETGGYDKPIFALGAVVFSINDDNEPVFFEEIMLNFKITEEYNTTYYNEDTWKYFWSKPNNFKVLQTMNHNSNCESEQVLIENFYNWWVSLTNKYKNIRIVTDSPTFDIGYTDSKIMKYQPLGEKSRPLVYQWNNDNVQYKSTIDYNTFELLIEETVTEPYAKLNEIINKNPFKHDHNPLNDSKHQAFQFSKLYRYMSHLLNRN